eukprot:gb/GEZN01010677.1/.p1 GENE.gb/GEZN01010677.1/~~gb/GEZN01010677.1/.p1  ORF type:complete len:366 (-),score=41.50 gb/GEZN01010677.1/:73-1170(-)
MSLETASESTPLLQLKAGLQERGERERSLSLSSMNMGDGFEPFPTKLSRWLGRCLERYDWAAPWCETIYTVLFANVFVICCILIIAKATGNEFFLEWSPKLAGLGNWNLQAANLMLVISYALRDFLMLRLSLFLACLCFIFYSATSPIGVMLDMLFFNVLLALLNVRHAISLMWEKRFVEFSPELEQVYSNVFRDFMSRADFARLADLALSRTEKQGVVIKQRGDLVTSLCILVSGRIEVLNSAGIKVNEYHSNEFLEAPEWVKCDLDPDTARFWVSFKTTLDCTYFKWPRETLVRLLSEEPRIHTALRAVLGIQTAQMWLRTIELKGDHQEWKDPPKASRKSTHDIFSGAATLDSPTISSPVSR